MPQMINLVVFDPGKMDDVIHAWMEAGVTGMTLLDTTGYLHHLQEAHHMRDDVPLFPSVRRLMRGTEEHSRMIFSIVPDDFDIDAVVQATERVLGPLEDPGNGILFILPVTKVVGLRPFQDLKGRE